MGIPRLTHPSVALNCRAQNPFSVANMCRPECSYRCSQSVRGFRLYWSLTELVAHCRIGTAHAEVSNIDCKPHRELSATTEQATQTVHMNLCIGVQLNPIPHAFSVLSEQFTYA